MSSYSRRTFLKQSAALAGLLSTPAGWLRGREKQFPDQPNLILIITDQERYTQWFPEDWEAKNLPHLQRLKTHGISFTQACCNSSMCTPSRATLLTGLYPNQHGVVDTLPEGEGQANHDQYTVLDPALPNLATMLKSAGYQVFYKGKWHLSYPAGAEWTAADVAKYGFDGWNPPDGGEDTAPENFGGGRANHDERCLQDTLALLEQVNPGQPFALVVSFINPHDVAGFPNTYELDYPESMLQGDLELPPTVNENPAENYKPHAHAELINKLALGLGTLLTPVRKKQYLNFYGNLLKKVDGQIGQILDALEKVRPDGSRLVDSTVVIRTADHGEVGLCHGGMRQKMFNVYEETLRLPLIFSNPVLFPEAVSSDAPVSLIDVMPTLATLTKVPNREKLVLKGTDFSPLLANPAASPVQDAILFVFDDIKAGQENIEQMISPPNRIRCLRESRWKYARYFDAAGEQAEEYEMYDLESDPQELENLAHPQHPRYNEPAVVAERNRLAEKLRTLEGERLQPLAAVAPNPSKRLPEGFQLQQNYPNPFNPRTEISYSLPVAARISLKIYDSLGREVQTLVETSQPAGNHHVIFDAAGRSSGIYVCKLTATANGTHFSQSRQMLLVK